MARVSKKASSTTLRDALSRRITARPQLKRPVDSPTPGRADPLSAELDFKLLFERAPGLFLVLRPDRDFTILWASDAYLLITGYERGNVIGRHLFDILRGDPDDPLAGTGSLRVSLERVVGTGKPDAMTVQKYEIGRPKSEGHGVEERFWSPVNAPVLGPKGELRYIVHRLDDVTGFVRAGAIAQRRQQELERELDGVGYSISHDLRAPLRAIDGFSRILEEDYGPKLDDEARRLLRVVRDHSRKLGELIDGILEFSRVGRRTLSLADIDMELMVADVLKDCEAAMPPAMKLGRLPRARGDAALIRQVWRNLLENALKFSGKREEPAIEVSATSMATENVYCVKDNGAGFDDQYSDRLFGLFQRLHPEAQFAGTGVGLAIVQRIVVRHGGRVWAESRPDAGASFYFSLPKAAGS